MRTICIMCPMGCPIEIIDNKGQIIVTGHTCKRGEVYGIQEYKSPKRVITSLVKIEGGGVTSVKTSDLVDKDMIFKILNELKNIRVTKPAYVGDVVISNFLDTCVDIVVTSEAI